MYGKFFSSAFTGSMLGAGTDVFAVWGYVIANTVNSKVELNPILLSAVLGAPTSNISDAIAFLCAADPKSRNKIDNGKRLVREGEYQYHVVNHSHYRAIRNEDDRREYNREKKRESRQRLKDVKRDVIDKHRKSTMSAHTEAEAYTETINKHTRFSPPTVDQVRTYCQERNNGIDAQSFVDHYEASGWVRGKTKIKDWKACVRTWEKNTPKQANKFEGAI